MAPTTEQEHDRLDHLKHEAAQVAVELVESDSVLGLGTGSTSAHFLRLLGERIRQGQLTNVIGVPTSSGAAKLAGRVGIPLTTLEDHPRLDLTVDGADEVDPILDMIKGGGGALLREKIVAQATRHLIIIVDESKLSERLGDKWPVPIEVLPFGHRTQVEFLSALGAEVKIRSTESGATMHTDQGNLILDCNFGPIDDAAALAKELDSRAGIVEHGLFLGMADEVIVAASGGVRRLHRQSS